MCYNCGCKMPYDNHGDIDNITEDYFERAADTKAMGGAGKFEAKKNVLELLEQQEKANGLKEPDEDYS